MGIPVRSAGLGAGLGAGVMFLFDPARGGRRRALVRDKLAKVTHLTRSAYSGTGRHLIDRLAGKAAMVRSRFRRDWAEDSVIEARVRTELGRVASHPRSICVRAENGAVTLTGEALASEVPVIDAAVRRVRGVQDVVNQLSVHTLAGRVRALQGHFSPRRSMRSSRIAKAWSPAVNRIVGGVGVAASLASAAIAIGRRRTSDAV
jgi:BON domain